MIQSQSSINQQRDRIMFVYDSKSQEHVVEYAFDQFKRVGCNKLDAKNSEHLEELVRLVRNYTNPRAVEVTILIK